MQTNNQSQIDSEYIYEFAANDEYLNESIEKPYNYTWKGVTEHTRKLMYQHQKGACPLCLRKRREVKRFVIDHCHRTGKVRGLLCDTCNITLGDVEANNINKGRKGPAWFNRALQYLAGKTSSTYLNLYYNRATNFTYPLI